MKSLTRIECEQAVVDYSCYLKGSGKLLYVGIAGDPPGGEYKELFSDNYDIITFDIGAKWKPDIVGDITKTNFEDNTWDIILCVQTIEHIPNIMDLQHEVFRILKPGGHLIVDCPWNYPYHAEEEFGDYWRFTKDGFNIIFSKFDRIQLYEGAHNTSCLYRKPI